MLILLSILTTILDSLTTVFWKKTIPLVSHISVYVDRILTYAVGNLPLGTLLILLGFGSFSSVIVPSVGLPLIAFSIIGMFTVPLSQKIYHEEKMSVILPYNQVSTIIATIITFFLFGNVSAITFGITIVAIGVVVAFSFDFRTLAVPRRLGLILLNQIITGTNIVLAGYLLSRIDSLSLFIYENYVWGIQLVIIVAIGGMLSREVVRSIPRSYYGYRLVSVVTGATHEILGYVIIMEAGVIVGTLLSFLGIGVSLLAAYILLREVPSRRDILQAVVLSVIVGVGMYFR